MDAANYVNILTGTPLGPLLFLVQATQRENARVRLRAAPRRVLENVFLLNRNAKRYGITTVLYLIRT